LDAEQLNVMGQSERFSGGRRRVLRILSGSLVSIWPVTVTRLRRQVMIGIGKPEGKQSPINKKKFKKPIRITLHNKKTV
jgi:hypothetical protein